MCLAIPVLASLSWTPHLRTCPPNGIRGVLIDLVNERFFTHPIETFWNRAVMTLKALVYPAGLDGFLVRQTHHGCLAWALVRAGDAPAPALFWKGGRGGSGHSSGG
jgi:hypothetical protein